MVSPSAANTGTPAKRSMGAPCAAATCSHSDARVSWEHHQLPHSLTLTHSLTCSAASTSRGSGTRRKAMSTAAGSLPLVSSTTLSNVIGTTCARQPQASEFVLTSKQLLLQGASHGEVESELERGSL
jgi:hypothetical protein